MTIHGGLSATGGFVYFDDNVGINAAGAPDGAGLAPLVVRTKENDGNNVIVGLRAKMSKANIDKELQKDISFVVRP